MAASMQLVSLPLQMPDISATHQEYRSRSLSFLSSKTKPVTVSLAASTSETSPSIPEKPEIELEFIGPKAGGDGSYPIDKASAISGDKLLRTIMLENKIELYPR
ncbi:hypothetical protein IFM89_004243, partial [Coptis chinensis]